MHQTLEEGGPEKDLAVGVSVRFFLVLCHVFLLVALWAILFVFGGSLGHLVCFPWLLFFFRGSLGHLVFLVALWAILVFCCDVGFNSDGSCGFLGLFFSGLANLSKYKGCLVSFENLKG